MKIIEARSSDLRALLEVEKQAFGEDEGPVIVELVKALLDDPTAKPFLSLVALDDQGVVGHVLFTKAQIAENEDVPVSLLAPIAVAPDLQRKGIGGRLIAEGLRLLTERGIALVFVLGHPEYYPRHGFKPAGLFGFQAPYPIPAEAADAWMVLALNPGALDRAKGRVLCADKLARPQYWKE